jgi:hypothetical protein
MAKISTYPIVGSPTLSDILIGTDVADSNNTKNFSIGGMLALVNDPTVLTDFVPYTGATNDVDLGTQNLNANDINLTGDLISNNQVNTQQLWVQAGFFDSTGFVGIPGQLLATIGGLATEWTTIDLDYILGQGGTSTLSISLTGTGSVSAHSVESTQILIVGGELEDSNSSIGIAGQVLSSTGFATEWVDVASVLNSYKGSFYDNLTQTLTGGANVAIPVILRQTDAPATNGVSIVTDGTNLTRITVANAGVYNILFSAQLANSGGTAQTVDFWLRKNGDTAAFNVPDSNGKVQLQSGANYLMAAWNYFIALNAGDYVYLMWTATSTNINMISAPTNGVHPATPSIIVTVNNV